ncbi:unnamed protein product [Hymenolepis diminuta]|uniref:Uncharacterized protein n=1 Tax=Hymenolepis diminuta TaxID=6216 RepID=A0A564Y3Z9_HYMDI|nr:unnamed protein product [Hymenolepis diminuta]
MTLPGLTRRISRMLEHSGKCTGAINQVASRCSGAAEISPANQCSIFLQRGVDHI